jgi:aryl-alcohol dehydrogenase-like predicted oxidoreductase
MNRLALGTAEFGMAYGLQQPTKMLPKSTITHILSTARAADVQVLDTAHAYGNSEEVLGHCLAVSHDFRIVTKAPPIRSNVVAPSDAKLLKQAFYQSLQRLNQKHIYGLLIHHAPDLIANGGEHLWKAMQDLQEKGLVRKIGVSVYTVDDLEAILNKYQIDLIQLPINIFDQRLLQGGGLHRLKKRGIEIHARSIFLKGALLMDPEKLPPYLTDLKGALHQFHTFSDSIGLTPLQAALSFAFAQPELDYILVGVNSFEEWESILNAVKHLPSAPPDWSGLALSDERLLNPSIWTTAAGGRA